MAGPERDEGLEDMDVSVEIHCEACGSANYSLPGSESDDAIVRCNDCGADQGSIGQLKAALVQQILDQSAESLRQGFDRLP